MPTNEEIELTPAERLRVWELLRRPELSVTETKWLETVTVRMDTVRERRELV